MSGTFRCCLHLLKVACIRQPYMSCKVGQRTNFENIQRKKESKIGGGHLLSDVCKMLTKKDEY